MMIENIKKNTKKMQQMQVLTWNTVLQIESFKTSHSIMVKRSTH